MPELPKEHDLLFHRKTKNCIRVKAAVWLSAALGSYALYGKVLGDPEASLQVFMNEKEYPGAIFSNIFDFIPLVGRALHDGRSYPQIPEQAREG